ncbi:hypothetical protein EV177_008212, partial [Coemansia sp. RSA 1804]
MVTKPKAPDSKDQEGTIDAAASAQDIESTKRNLQALVAAGIHAQGLLGQDDDDDDDDGNNDDESTEDESGEESQNDGHLSVDYEEEEMASGNILAQLGAQFTQNDGSNGAGAGHGGALSLADEDNHQQSAAAEDSHQDLLSR